MNVCITGLKPKTINIPFGFGTGERKAYVFAFLVGA